MKKDQEGFYENSNIIRRGLRDDLKKTLVRFEKGPRRVREEFANDLKRNRKNFDADSMVIRLGVDLQEVRVRIEKGLENNSRRLSKIM